MANRLSRDTILNRALDLLDSARLNEHDRGGNPPTSTIATNALSIGWLQDSLDLAHNLYPHQATIITTPLTLTAGVGSYSSLPSNYIIDYKDGILLSDDKGRVYRRGMSFLMQFPTVIGARGKPKFYCVRNNLLEVRPYPDQTYSATLYYYALPAALGPADIPTFPSDFILVEYVKMRGLEWMREIPGDSANKYLVMTMGELVKAGLGQEAEEDQIPADRVNFPGEAANNIGGPDWMISSTGIL